MSGPESSASRRSWLWALAFAAGVAIAVGAGTAWRAGAPAPDDDARAGLDDDARAGPAPEPAAPGEPAVPSGRSPRIELTRQDFPPAGPVAIHLELAEPLPDAGPRAVRLFSPSDRRVLELEGVPDAGRASAVVEVDPDWLQPGEYLVELLGVGRSHFPVRRYVLVVR